MSNYTVTTNFGAKDSLPSGNAAKVIKGSEFTTEFTNIQTAIATKADTAGDTFTGAVTFDAAVTLNADVTFDTNTLFVDVSENRVGIGNVAPATALDVTGTVTASGLTVDTDTLHVDATNDRVGIGTTSPQAPLDVRGSSIKLTGGNPLFYLLDNSNTNTCSLQNTDGNFKYHADSGNQIGNSKHTFSIDGSNAMRIDTTGVGIGTDSPQKPLHVNAGTGNIGIRVESTDSEAEIEFMDNTTSGTLNSPRIGGVGNDLFMQTDGTERMRIDSSGNVGVGTSSPSTALHIDSLGATALTLQRNSGASSNISIKYSGVSQDFYTGIASVSEDFVIGTAADLNGNNLLRVTSAGNVGIGTTDPQEILHAVGNIRLGGVSPAELYTNANELRIGVDKNNDNDASEITFYTNDDEKVRITKVGNVGIGTDSPDSKLHVQNGDIKITSDSASGADGIASLLFTEFDDDNAQYSADVAHAIISYHGAGQTGDNNYLGFGVFNQSNASEDTLAEQKLLTDLNITRNGKVGIGTSSPSNPFHVYHATTNIVGMLESGDTTCGIDLKDSEATGRITNTSGKLSIQADTGAEGADSRIDFKVDNSEKMRIDSSGNLLVGKTSADNTTAGCRVRGDGFASFVRSGAEPLLINRLTDDGSVLTLQKDGTTVGSISVTSSATAYNTSSDERLKENIADSADAGSKIDAIQIRQFDWKADGSHQDYGVIAQELVTVAPEAVHQPEDSEEMMGVDYSKLVPMLIKEVQSLRSRVAELENN